MNRFQPELVRLFGLDPTATGERPTAGIRAAVLAVLLPVGWEQLASVWRGVQSELELPAPAIAVSGDDALQLWFSFASPISSSAARRFLQGLRERYLPGIGSSQVRLFSEAAELPALPCVEIGPQRWSAFVTHDLASVFAETPWLDIPPTDDGQATILRALQPIRTVAFEAAMSQLGGLEDPVRLEPVSAEPAGCGPAEIARPRAVDPARFLTGVMNDESVPLALRMEAARILLGCARAG